MTEVAVRPRAARIVGLAIVFAALVILALVALSATALLGRMIDERWQTFPGTIGIGGLVASLVPFVVMGVGIVVLRRASDETLRRWALLAPLLVLVLLRLGAIVLAPTPIAQDNDPRHLHELATGVLLEGRNPLVSPRPMGYSTVLAGLYAIFGIQPVLAELLNLTSAVLAGWVLFLITERAWGRRAAAMAAFMYAVVPSQVLMVTAVFTETLYSAVLLAAIALATSAVAGQRTILMVGAGVVLAFSQYVRPVSQSFLPIFVSMPLLVGLRWSRGGLLAAALVGSFVVAMTPILVHNATVHGDLSLSTSSYGGWSVFVGANQVHSGRFNRDDQAILRETPGRTVWEQSEILGRAGIERITSDPGRFAGLAVRKFRILWGDDTYAVASAFPGWETTSVRHEALRVASQGIYVVITVLAIFGLWQTRHDPAPAVLLLAGIIVTVAIAHLFVEVQPRYHAYLVPLLCAIAAVSVVGWRPGASASG